jgi:hypothetical protein
MSNFSVSLHYTPTVYCLNYIPEVNILGGAFFFSWPGAGLTNRVHVRDFRAGAPLPFLIPTGII